MLEIREIRSKQELLECLAVRKAVFIDGMNISVKDEVDELDVYPPKGATHFIFLLDEKPVGTLRLIDEGNNMLHLGRFAILKEYRRLGLGSKALAYLFSRYPNHNFYLHAMKYVQSFYEASGFSAVGEPFDECGIEHIEMRKKAIR